MKHFETTFVFAPFLQKKNFLFECVPAPHGAAHWASQQAQQYLATPFPGISPTIKSLFITKERGCAAELVLPYLKCEISG